LPEGTELSGRQDGSGREASGVAARAVDSHESRSATVRTITAVAPPSSGKTALQNKRKLTTNYEKIKWKLLTIRRTGKKYKILVS
jgi:hypothetical protein